MTIYHIIMMALIVTAVGAVLFVFLRPDSLSVLDDEAPVDIFSIDYLTTAVLEYTNNYQNMNVDELDMNKQTIEKIAKEQETITEAISLCAFGDKDSKHFLKELIKSTLTKNYEISAETINKVIPFDMPEAMSNQDKFDCLMHIYYRKWGKEGLKRLFKLNKWDKPHGEGYLEHYVVTVSDLEETFNSHIGLVETLRYQDKLEIVAQRIYSMNWGLGCVDSIFDMDVDGVNAGTSGIPAPLHKYLGDRYSEDTGDLPLVSYNAVWVFFEGKLVHMGFLGFLTEREFERVCKKIYKYDNPGTLSEDKGGIVNYRMDGSRVTVTRPPATENWSFFVRKLDAGAKMDVTAWFQGRKAPEERDTGISDIVELLRWIVSGCLNLAITGEQGCGKTTFMMSVIDFVRKSFSIRSQEMSFELNLKQKYMLSNILAFRDTPTFSGQQGIDLQKKTDGSVNLMGEVATHMQGYLTIQTGETGSNQVMFTGHMKTAELLIGYFRDCMCNVGGMTEKSAESLCAKVLNTNIHLVKDVDGHRHATRITMIVPHVMENYPSDLEEAQKQYYYRQTDRPVFETVDLIRYQDHGYRISGEFTQEMKDHIKLRLSDTEREEFDAFCDYMHEQAMAYQAEFGSTSSIGGAAVAGGAAGGADASGAESTTAQADGVEFTPADVEFNNAEFVNADVEFNNAEFTSAQADFATAQEAFNQMKAEEGFTPDSIEGFTSDSVDEFTNLTHSPEVV